MWYASYLKVKSVYLLKFKFTCSKLNNLNKHPFEVRTTELTHDIKDLNENQIYNVGMSLSSDINLVSATTKVLGEHLISYMPTSPGFKSETLRAGYDSRITKL